MLTAPQSVDFREPFMYSVTESSGLLNWDTPWPDPETAKKAFEFPCSVMDRLTTFSNLHTMVFEGITLPFELYSFLFLFPELRELALLECRAPTTNESVKKRFPFEDLPITTLRIIDTRSQIVMHSPPTAFSAIGSIIVSDDTDDYNILHLATAKNLRHLHINWNTTTAIFFGALAKSQVIGYASEEFSESKRHIWAFPPHLETLSIISLTKWQWSFMHERQHQIQRRSQTVPLNTVLKACQGTLRKLEIEGHVFSVFHHRRRARMRKLEAYEGPLEFLKSVWTPKGQLKKIRIVDLCHSLLGGRRDGSNWSIFQKNVWRSENEAESRLCDVVRGEVERLGR